MAVDIWQGIYLVFNMDMILESRKKKEIMDVLEGLGMKRTTFGTEYNRDHQPVRTEEGMVSNTENLPDAFKVQFHLHGQTPHIKFDYFFGTSSEYMEKDKMRDVIVRAYDALKPESIRDHRGKELSIDDLSN